jgi:hypothetical protein
LIHKIRDYMHTDVAPWTEAAHRAICNLEKDKNGDRAWTINDAICKDLGTDPRDPPKNPPPF